MLASLYHLADCGVLHADIKPDNILINSSHNAVKVCDLLPEMQRCLNRVRKDLFVVVASCAPTPSLTTFSSTPATMPSKGLCHHQYSLRFVHMSCRMYICPVVCQYAALSLRAVRHSLHNQ